MDDVEGKLKELHEQTMGDDGWCATNAQRAARVLWPLFHMSRADADNVVRDALCELRHACDLLGLSFSDEDRAAHRVYMAEVAERGVASFDEPA